MGDDEVTSAEPTLTSTNWRGRRSALFGAASYNKNPQTSKIGSEFLLLSPTQQKQGVQDKTVVQKRATEVARTCCQVTGERLLQREKWMMFCVSPGSRPCAILDGRLFLRRVVDASHFLMTRFHSPFLNGKPGTMRESSMLCPVSRTTARPQWNLALITRGFGIFWPLARPFAQSSYRRLSRQSRALFMHAGVLGKDAAFGAECGAWRGVETKVCRKQFAGRWHQQDGEP